MDPITMQFDDVYWEKSEEMFDAWRARLFSKGIFQQIGALIHKHRGGVPVELHSPVSGSFNVCLRLEFSDGGSAMIRYAVGGHIMLPQEKVRTEVAVMRFIADSTLIPVPLVLYCSNSSEESPGGLGSFMITEYVKHHHNLGEALKMPGRPPSERFLLDPSIDPSTLALCYRRLAEVLFQLQRPALARIGSFAEESEDEWSVTKPPFTYNMNELLQMSGFPASRLPTTTFSTASSYYLALANMNLDHLSAQLNDAVESEHDCRRKYVARHLFCKLASEGRLDHFPSFEHGPFKLFCEDLRPNNFLVTENNFVAGVVDWEFTIAAPAGFSFAPPWWLLLEHPVKWLWGLDKWEEACVGRLQTFLEVLQEVEAAAGCDDGQRLSSRMKESWDSGAFHVEYAVQRSWAFDHIYFNRLDEKFFGKIPDGGDWLAERLCLLTEEQRRNMEPFVQKKMNEHSTRQPRDERFEALELPPLEQVEP